MARAFERATTIALPDEAAGEGATLEGLFVAGEGDDCGGVLIAPPHPQMGGSMESPVVTEIAYAFARAGLASLRFNWRGVGASAGLCSGDPEVADVDYRAGLAYLRETVRGPILASGYSFGALAALRASAHARDLGRLLLVAPPTRMLDRDRLREFPNPMLIACGEHDDFVDLPLLSTLSAEARAARLETIGGADHFFMQGLPALREAITSWLET